MDYLLFARISDYYVLLGDALEPLDITPSNSRFYRADLVDDLLSQAGDSCSTDVLRKIIPDELLAPGAYVRIIHGERFRLLIPIKSSKLRLSMAGKRQHEAITSEAASQVEQLRLQTKKRLIESLFANPTSLSDYVRAWSEYLFCDHYSLWIYNHYTEVFICSASSFPYTRTHIARSEGSSLNRVLEPDYRPESRQLRKDRANFDQTRDMRTLNRIKLSLGLDGTIGVLSFYSRYPRFALKRRNHREIQHSIETKYLQVRQQARQPMTEINQHFIESYHTGELHQFLHRIVAEICDKFQSEACSILLHDAERELLTLVAICDAEQRGEPAAPFSYDLHHLSRTTRVFRTRELSFSYDLAGEREQDAFSEKTLNPATNDIIVPLHDGDASVGVLRVRNKFEVERGKHTIVNFRNSDFVNLLALAANLANLIRIELMFNEQQKNLRETNSKMREMEDFNKVFLHEIRTPISKFTMAPELIKRTLRNPRLSEEQMAKVMKQLDDIQVMGDRLEFVAKTFNFNQIVTRRNFQVLSVLRDIVYPVINITRSYLRKQYEIDIQLETTGLQSSRVYGDKTLLNIVFNTLIDNAGKYSVGTRKPITVAGGYEGDGDHFAIQVSNYGLPIDPEEATAVFDKGVRGREAIEHGIGGTGIGLHLAQQIMLEGGGELLLTSMADPVTFTIRIPARPKGSPA